MNDKKPKKGVSIPSEYFQYKSEGGILPFLAWNQQRKEMEKTAKKEAAPGIVGQNYEMSPALECRKCGGIIHFGHVWSGGRYINHRSGTVSFQIYNADRKCPYCEMKELEKLRERLLGKEDQRELLAEKYETEAGEEEVNENRDFEETEQEAIAREAREDYEKEKRSEREEETGEVTEGVDF